MRLVEIIKRSIAESYFHDTRSTYGYMISPTGEAHAVPYEGHASFAWDEHGVSLDQLLEMGWVRVVSHSSFNVEFDVSISRSAISTIRKLLRDGHYSRYYVDNLGIGDSKSFEKARLLLGYLGAHAK